MPKSKIRTQMGRFDELTYEEKFHCLKGTIEGLQSALAFNIVMYNRLRGRILDLEKNQTLT